jgi:acetate kinase
MCYIHAPPLGRRPLLARTAGCDALVFTGGIGENNPWLREAVCAELDQLGIIVDRPRTPRPGRRALKTAADVRAGVFVIAANEELVVARETRRTLS